MQPLISTQDLARRLSEGRIVVIDARFRLQEQEAGKRLYGEGHIPGAFFADLERDLSGQKNGRNGRHPFPEKEKLRAFFSRLGIDQETLVVTYDDIDHSGAARAWALLRWMGHEKVQVLDGGIKAWEKEGLPVEPGFRDVPGNADFSERDSSLQTCFRESLDRNSLIDVRSVERFRGELEPIDPVAGHIPGAKNLPYLSFLDENRKFHDASKLRAILDSCPRNPIFYCGSGVTACVALLACAVAGREGRLYPGSWSEWCSDPKAPVEKG